MKTVIEMAGEIDAVTEILLYRKEPQGMSHEVFVWFLERFAEIVRADAIADERAECAVIAETAADYLQNSTFEGVAAAIRARSNK